MSRFRVTSIGIIVSHIVLIGGLLILYQHIERIKARDDMLTHCMILFAYLGALDSNEMNAEEKVSRLQESTATRMAQFLAALDHMDMDTLSLADLTHWDTGMSNDDYNRAKSNIEHYLTARAKSKSMNRSSETRE